MNSFANNEILKMLKKLQQQVPKVKIADKITALQQMVSPFGKVNALTTI